MVAGSLPDLLIVTVWPDAHVNDEALWSPVLKSISKTGDAVSGEEEFHILVEKTGPLNG